MMSIRFRLTLLYSTILALTLIIFGVVLYSIQARDTLDSLKRDLVLSSELFVEASRRTAFSHTIPGNEYREPPQPKAFEDFSSDRAFKDLREREIVRILDTNGDLIASPSGRVEDALPLDDAGLSALQNQEEWWDDGIVSGEHMLIFSRPIVEKGRTTSIIQIARSLTERDRTLKSLSTTLGVTGILTILIAFAAGWVLSGITLRPIHRITQTAQAIGEERDFSRRVTYTGPPDELGQLANTFNQMLAHLQNAYQKIEHALQMQRGFVADVSHELRTPLTTIRGNLGLLHRDPPAPIEEQNDILNDMVDESDRLIRLVNNLLQLAHADAGWRFSKEPLEIKPILEESIRQAHQLDLHREIVFVASSEFSILGDRDALKQVILILLDNALKHSNGGIEVNAFRIGARVEIRIKDHGQGISPEKLENVFDRFFRDNDRSIAPGFGLGLPIAKVLTEGVGGTIMMESEIGIGSAVILQFPVFDPEDIA